MDQDWGSWFWGGVGYSAGGVVHADEAEGKDEVVRARTGTSPRDHLVQRL